MYFTVVYLLTSGKTQVKKFKLTEISEESSITELLRREVAWEHGHGEVKQIIAIFAGNQENLLDVG